MAVVTAEQHADAVGHVVGERELAAYATPAHRRDLETTLDRYPDGITCELRDILARQASAAAVKAIPDCRPY
jgi:hypothetical protein